MDGNRQTSAIEIGRRFLGINEELKAIDQDSEKLESNNINNITSPKNNQITTTNNDSEKIVDGEGENENENSDLVLDILNDELIEQVRQKIHSKLRFN